MTMRGDEMRIDVRRDVFEEVIDHDALDAVELLLDLNGFSTKSRRVSVLKQSQVTIDPTYKAN